MKQQVQTPEEMAFKNLIKKDIEKIAGVEPAGNDSMACGKIGSWLTLAEWKEQDGEWGPVCVKTERIDGERIKADTFYKLTNGEFTEVENEQ